MTFGDLPTNEMAPLPKINFQNIPRYQTLRKILAEAAGNDGAETDLEFFLSTIGVVDSIDCLMMTIGNFKAIESLSEKICSRAKWSFARQHILKSIPICNLALKNRNQIKSRAIRLVEGSADKDRNSNFRNRIRTAPLFATISYLPNDRKQSKKYFQLLTQILIAKFLVDRKKGSLEEELKDALTATRSITRYDILKELPEGPVPPEEFLNMLNGIKNESHLPRIIKFLSRALTLGKTYTLKTLGHELFAIPNRDKDSSLVEALLEPELPQEYWPEILEEEQNFIDGEPAAQNGRVFLVAASKMPTMSKGDFLKTARQVTKTRAMDNQLFNFSWNALNQHDLNVIFKFFSEEHWGTVKNLTKLRAQLALIFSAGITPERLVKIRISNSDTSLPNSDTFIIPTSTLRLFSPGPEYKTELTQDMVTQTVIRQTHIDLSLPDFFSGLILKHLQSSPAHSDKVLFTCSPATIQDTAAKALRKLNSLFETRLTLPRVQNFIERKLAALAYNDIAGASLTLGKSLYLARTSVHYAGLDTEELNRLYHYAWYEIFKIAGIDSPKPDGYTDAAPIHVGTPIRPRTSTIQELIVRLKKILLSLKDDITSLAELVIYHNTYTLYTFLVIAYSTGYRAVNAPYITEEMYDEPSGFCVIRDKDSINFYHSHLTWLCPNCLKQLSNYRAHIAKIKGMSSIPLGSSDGKDTEFFFLSHDGKRESATRSKIEQQLRTFDFFLPARVHRQFLKSELQEIGCPGEIIEIMLGHWHVGQEGWAINSALHPLHYKETLKKYLPALIRRLDLKPIAGIENIPTEIQLNLHELTHLEKQAKKKKKKKKPAGNDSFFQENKPGEVWFKILGNLFQNEPANRAFKPQEKFVLLKVYKTCPELYFGTTDTCLSEETISKIIKRIKPEPMHHKNNNKRLNFLIDGLEWGKKHLNWVVDIPHRPASVPKPFNLVRPSLTRKMKTYRSAEKAFLKDLERPYPQEPEVQIGQIIVSAILFGGINRRSWAEALLKGIGSNIYQHETLLWIDLWTQSKFDTEPNETWRRQKNSSLYRRWGADPTTQFLIYRWLNQNESGRQATASIPLKKIYKDYCHRIETNGDRMPALNTLLGAANAWITLNLPPFLSAFATSDKSTTSLVDPAWMRLLTGKHYNLEKFQSETRSIADQAEVDTKTNKLPKIFLSELRSYLKDGNSQKNVAEEIDRFLQRNSKMINTTFDLLGRWATHLLSPCTTEFERRKAAPERPSTVFKYLGTFANEYLAAGSDISLVDLDDDEFMAFFKKVVTAIEKKKRKHSSQSKDNRIEYILDRVNQFLEFLHVVYERPDIHVAVNKDQVSVVKGNTVRANILTPSEYQHLLIHLGWGSKNLTRFEKMVILMAIFAFRTGMRLSEIHGLLIRDIQGTDQIEVLVQKNWIRELKTANSRRRLPLYLLLPKEELAFLTSWHKFRTAELGSRPKSPLFTTGPMEPEPIPKQELENTLLRAIKQITGDNTADVHMLRHTFDTLLLPRLLLRNDITITPLPDFLNADEFKPEAIKTFKSRLLENETSGRKALYAGAGLLGHADTETEINTYFHLSDWLTWYFLRHQHCRPELSKQAIIAITETSQATVYRKMRNGENPLDAVLSKKIEKFCKILAHPLATLAVDTSDFRQPDIEVTALEPFDLALHQTHSSLQNSKEIRWPKTRVEIWVLKTLYDKFVNYANTHPQNAFCAASILNLNYKNHDKGVLIDTPYEARIVIELFQALNIQFSIKHYQSRWDKTEKAVTALQGWQEKLGGIEIVSGEHNCGRNLPQGLVRIFIHYVTVANYTLEFEPKVSTILKIMTLMVAWRMKKPPSALKGVH